MTENLPDSHVTSSSLRHVSPLIYWICWGYIFTNELIGFGLLETPTKLVHYVIIQGVFTTQFWGGTFILLGLIGAVALLLNHWKSVRRIMLLGLFIKAMWFYALIASYTRGSLGLIGIWAFLFYVQFLTVVFFPRELR